MPRPCPASVSTYLYLQTVHAKPPVEGQFSLQMSESALKDAQKATNLADEALPDNHPRQIG